MDRAVDTECIFIMTVGYVCEMCIRQNGKVETKVNGKNAWPKTDGQMKEEVRKAQTVHWPSFGT